MTRRSTVVDGRQVRWRVTGEGAPLVCIHGLGASHRWWWRVAPGLASRCELHLLDVPRFHPRRAADWLLRWLEAAALERPSLLGHSLGGLIAAQVAMRTELDRLILVSPAGIPSGRTFFVDAFHLFASGIGVKKFTPAIARDAFRSGPLTLARGGRFVRATNLSGDLASIAAPTLLLWGDRDRLVPYAQAAAWQRALPNARLVTLPGARHVAIVESPDLVVDAVVEFLDESRDEPRVRPVDGVRAAAHDGDGPDG